MTRGRPDSAPRGRSAGPKSPQLMVTPSVRFMSEADLGLIVDYFHQSSPEHLETLGVDPSRLPEAAAWRQWLSHENAKPLAARKSLFVVWEVDGRALGFSTADKIVFGEQAHMHLHIVDAVQRRAGLGSACVKQSARLYFEALQLERLFCEPNAFNVAPNRALQKAGFSYVKTHRTVPGPLNFHQAVTRWVLTADDLG